jgi:hypothetical protein
MIQEDTDTQVPQTSEAKNPSDAPPVKKSIKKRYLVLICLALVVVVAGVGGLVWHNSPSFCGTLCHRPMASYVEGYESGDAALLITTHKDNQYTCLDCHEATIADQFEEASKYVTGDYTVPLAPSGIGTRGFCLDCHEMEAIISATDDYSGVSAAGVAGAYNGLNNGVNPHQSHMGELQCDSCHSMHGESVLTCNECHFLPLPEGWTDAFDGAGIPDGTDVPQ